MTHERVRHTECFTVVGNHLAQHRRLSLKAIGLAVHIQSLPDGARVDIKTLAAQFPEGEVSIAAALRELEAHGYLTRRRRRLPGGRIVTQTTCHHRPAGAVAGRPGACRPQARARVGAGRRHPDGRSPAPAHEAPPPPPDARALLPEAPPPAPRRTAPPLPEPRRPESAPYGAARGFLVRLRRSDTRLLLSEGDVRRLTPAVAAWFERGASPEALRNALTANLPEPLTRPAGLIGYRLTALLPPASAPAAQPPLPRPPDPFQECDTCPRVFRAPRPGGSCPVCRAARDVERC
ncbi:helix-turn-helix domain-containing protein [Streptomyces sp. WMMC897]|uniref:helix-turn-helix domain-containing protein n=1 Tax=Streptomyces sp. WMMC897 TaxID=3014782 RepID=UPI0022B7034A|nr:helix-turn-helix domain-containing protein [Streptomyces sp. WMMC897]MCZ7414691.1 helix-turn-helix domain-containing protein [Streptomyces sp. WMMC897]